MLWFLPAPAPIESLLSALEETCRGRATLETSHVPLDTEWPIEWLASRYHLDATPPSGNAVASLYEADTVPEILILRDLENASDGALGQWKRFISEWVGYSKRPDIMPAERKALLIPVRDAAAIAALDEMAEDAFLAKAWYRGWVTSRETRVVAAALFEDHGISGAKALWGEAVWSNLAGSDLECLAWMMEKADIDSSIRDQLRVVREYAEARAFSPVLDATQGSSAREEALAHTARAEHLPESPSSSAERLLWSTGLLTWDHDEGPVVHSAALALLGRTADLNHRVWRGQAAILLPMLDRYRLEVCHILGQRFTEWAEFARTRDAEVAREPPNEDCGAVEFGDIVEFLDRFRTVPWLRQLRQAVDRMRRVRNTLAHYSPVEWPEFRDVCEEFWRLRRNGGVGLGGWSYQLGLKSTHTGSEGPRHGRRPV
ncbi:hypothetical protein [Limnochorda pilosa]|uniref:hypothetical protein n=1 Tax=Limnochorda pilosa TaxID=1555112 RepID=UPI0011873E4B|nr:hypothetical protein [Limnochorda pilosa]